MALAERLVEYVRACFTGLWIESHEHEDALTEIAALCREPRRHVVGRSVAGGRSGLGTVSAAKSCFDG